MDLGGNDPADVFVSIDMVLRYLYYADLAAPALLRDHLQGKANNFQPELHERLLREAMETWEAQELGSTTQDFERQARQAAEGADAAPILVLDRYGGGDPRNCTHGSFTTADEFRKAALRQALQLLETRHPALHMCMQSVLCFPREILAEARRRAGLPQSDKRVGIGKLVMLWYHKARVAGGKGGKMARHGDQGLDYDVRLVLRWTRSGASSKLHVSAVGFPDVCIDVDIAAGSAIAGSHAFLRVPQAPVEHEVLEVDDDTFSVIWDLIGEEAWELLQALLEAKPAAAAGPTGGEAEAKGV
jgi:hypothetical protein